MNSFCLKIQLQSQYRTNIAKNHTNVFHILLFLWIFLSWAQVFSWIRYKQHFNFFYNLVEQKKEGKARQKKKEKEKDEAADKKLLGNVGRELKNSPHPFDP